MIRTDIDIKDALHSWIIQSTLAHSVSGKVYKDARPLNSDKEDIVISVLARDAGAQIQEALVNVNIYVPDVRRGKEAVEDAPRLRTLASEAAGLFEYKQGGNYIFSLSSQEILKVNGLDWHAINNRLRVRYNNE